MGRQRQALGGASRYRGLQERPLAGDCDSCSVYGTGRIHCEQSRSVNYRRAINRAETDPRASEHLTPSAWTSFFRGAGAFSVPVPSAWPILALAHFCLCVSALSNHVQCQYGKSGLLRPRPPPLHPWVSTAPQLPGPSGLMLGEGTALSWWPADRLTLPGARVEAELGNLSRANRWSCWGWGWGSPSVRPASVMP